eukprot:scaffold52385_cov34-Tisochrysis_lutea.AAC.5
MKLFQIIRRLEFSPHAHNTSLSAASPASRALRRLFPASAESPGADFRLEAESRPACQETLRVTLSTKSLLDAHPTQRAAIGKTFQKHEAHLAALHTPLLLEAGVTDQQPHAAQLWVPIKRKGEHERMALALPGRRASHSARRAMRRTGGLLSPPRAECLRRRCDDGMNNEKRHRVNGFSRQCSTW